MISELSQTPKSLRLHIGVFGGVNGGKSTLINGLTGQNTALTSPVAGTTTDPVFKPMELLPIGPVVFIDTAGLDDTTELGPMRTAKSMEQLPLCDCCIAVVRSGEDFHKLAEFLENVKSRGAAGLIAVNRFQGEEPCNLPENLPFPVVQGDFTDSGDLEKIKGALIEILSNSESVKRLENVSLTGHLVKSGDFALLIAPQDLQAPKGRLIMPQVQTMRDLLDNGCFYLTVQPSQLEKALNTLKVLPDLIITDSQLFSGLKGRLPESVPLTSFSLLMSRAKGEASGLIEGVKILDMLNPGDRVMIMESCTHHPLDGDIARVKLPKLLNKYVGGELEFLFHAGGGFPENLEGVKLVLHCGGCMLNRRAFIGRQQRCQELGIPMTNFGAALAVLSYGSSIKINEDGTVEF